MSKKKSSTEKNVENKDQKLSKKEMEDEVVSKADSLELESILDEDYQKLKRTHPIFIHIFSILLVIASILSFLYVITRSATSLYPILCSLLITVFTIVFAGIVYSSSKKNPWILWIGEILLFVYFFISILSLNTPRMISSDVVPNFIGKSLTDVVKWANKNHITIVQEYEYSDMIEEYSIISQNYSTDTSIKDISELTVSVSEGPNPSKEIVIPSMITWDSDRVLQYIKDHYLNNVVVEFISSDKAENTVIEQSVIGNLKRNDELRLVFSYGEELGFQEVTLIDFTNKSKFEVEFYMKQHQLRYEFGEDYSDTIKKGYALSQSIAAGDVVSVNDQRITVTISKGPKIEVPNLSKMSLEKITEWAIQNKLKLSFKDAYDDSIPENGIVQTNYSKGDIVEQGTVISITLSRGPLKMQKFTSINDFYSWADKYGILYEEEHEFSDSVSTGDIIQFSYKAGDVIKNNDIIIVTISDGIQKSVPNLKGLTKSQAISKLKKVGLNYSFVYRESNEDKDTVIGQSISAGSEVSSNTTISITLSSGQKSSNSSNNTSNNNSNNNNNEEDEPSPTTCTTCPRISPAVISSYLADDEETCSDAISKIKSAIQNICPGIQVDIRCQQAYGYHSKDFISGFNGGTKYNGETLTSCSSISIVIAQ